MNFGTKSAWTQILVWLIWLMAVLVFMQPTKQPGYQPDRPMPLLGVVTHDNRNGPLFPWQARYRWFNTVHFFRPSFCQHQIRKFARNR